MKIPVPKRAAASRKSWRTRKRMAAARSAADPVPDFNIETVKLFDRYHVTWPAYIRRALPCPNFAEEK